MGDRAAKAAGRAGDQATGGTESRCGVVSLTSSARMDSTIPIRMYTLSSQINTNCGLNRDQTKALLVIVNSTNSTVPVLSLSSLKERKRTFDTIKNDKPMVTAKRSTVYGSV